MKPQSRTQPSPVQIARQRFGQPFAFEPGATWKPRSTPLLTEWLSTRTEQKRGAN